MGQVTSMDTAKIAPKAVAIKAEPVTAADKLGMNPDRIALNTSRQPIVGAVDDMRKGLIEMIAGTGAFVIGGVGAAVAFGLSAPVAVPLALGALAVIGACVALKGVIDYKIGAVELIVDLLLAPFRFFAQFGDKA